VRHILRVPCAAVLKAGPLLFIASALGLAAPPASATDQQVAAGEAAYAKDCASCHRTPARFMRRYLDMPPQERALSATPAGEDTCMSPPVARPAGRLSPGAEPWPMPVDLFAADDVTGRPTLRAEHAPAVLFRFAQDTAQRLGVDPAAVALAGAWWRCRPSARITADTAQAA
jgi:hypothetical protein